MKILMVGPSREANGGMATVVNNYFNSKLTEKVELKFISTTRDGSIIIRLLYNFVAFLKILLTMISDRKIDIVHIHMSHRGSFYRKAIYIKLSKMFSKKVIIHLHSSQFDKFYENELKDNGKKYVEKIFNSADKVVVLSEEWKEKILSWFNCNIKVLHNSVFVPKSNNYNNESTYITLLGRLNERKGTYDIIQAIENLSKKTNIDKYKFVLAGDGDLEKLNRNIKEKNIGKHIEVLGWINTQQRDEVLKKTIIYVLPSYNEGMPMSVLEAMSYGIPTISTYVGGIPKIIDNNENGILIHAGDIKALEDSIIFLIENSDVRERISKNAYESINRKFSIDNNINELLEIYNEVLK